MVMMLAHCTVVAMVFLTAYCSVASKVGKMVTDWEQERAQLF